MLTEHQQRFIKIIEGLRYGCGVVNVFEDFVRLGTYEISQNTRRSLGWEIDDGDEESYLEIVKRYKPEEVKGPFVEMFACLVEGLEKMEGDFLGPIFMEMGLGNSALGQFFTPYHISLLMAKLSIDKDVIRREIDQKGYVVMNDPCCGSGGMPIAYAQAFREAGFNPETELFIVAQDLGNTAANMTYLQLSLRGIAAQVLNMNSLIPDQVFWGRFTPVYFWKGWPFRLNGQREQVEMIEDSNIIDCETKEVVAEAKGKVLPKAKSKPKSLPSIQKSLFDGLT